MKPSRVAVVGGGPAGLYFAYLFKKSTPGSEVVVFEQNEPDTTFGFGIELAEGSLKWLELADAESYDAIRAKIHRTQHRMIFHEGVGVMVDQVAQGCAISRLTLLAILSKLCERVGVELRFGQRVETNNPWSDADLVVGADGTNSAIRSQNSAVFGTSINSLSNRFAWYGATAKFEMPVLSFRQYNGGHFVAHYCPYSAEMGTFIAECDKATWENLALGAMSDVAKQQLMETIFSEELEGQPLVSNRSSWRTFPVVVNERWSAGSTVLIGDALHSAHFSFGSGTRIAMEDSISLWKALSANDSVSGALKCFENERRPAKVKLLEAAKASYTWYEGFADGVEYLMPVEFAYDYMTRTGCTDNDRLREEHPVFMQEYATWRRQQGYSGCC